MVLPPERVRAQLAAQRGGADVVFDQRGERVGGARLLAVVTLTPSEQGRTYRLPTPPDYDAVRSASVSLAALVEKGRQDGGATLSPVPDEPLPPIGTLGFRVQRYGMLQWGDLFTARQKLVLLTLNQRIANLTGGRGAAGEVAGLALSRVTDIFNALCQWGSSTTQVLHLFTRQAIAMLWDFAEAAPFADQAGDYSVTLRTMTRALGELPAAGGLAHVQIADACEAPLPLGAASVWFTDPPYYDAVPYADLSDFFFVWLKRALPSNPLLRDPFDQTSQLTPKSREAVQDEVKPVVGGTDETHELIGDDSREQFLLDLGRGTIRLSKLKFQTRARKVIVLVRLDIDGAPHTNPDGQQVGRTHLHLYRDGSEDKWAFPLDPNQFTDPSNMRRAFDDFCRFCSIRDTPQFQEALL